MLTALFVIGIYFTTHWAFVAIIAARSKRLTVYWRVMLYPLAAAGLVLDVAFNLTFGTVMYLELPREMLFTSRCNRHFQSSGGRRQRLAVFWAKQLNLFDAEHIRL